MKIWFKFFFTAVFINTALFKNINNNADISSEENTQNSIKTLESVDVDAITIDTVTIEPTNKINIIENNLNKVSNLSTNSENSTPITNELITNVNLLKNSTINSEFVTTEYISSISRNMLTIVPESSTELNNFETDEENEETYKSNENTDYYENETDLNLFINNEATSKITTLTDDLTDSELKNRATSKDAEVLLTSTNHETQTAFPENTTYKSVFNSSVNYELLAASESKSLNSTTTNNKEMFPNSSSNNNFQKNDSNVATNDTILNSSEADKSLKNYYWLLKEETDYGSTPSESEKSEITSYTLVPTVTFLSTEKVDEGKTSDTSTESTTELTSEYPSSTPSVCSDNVQVKGLEITPSPYSLSLTWSPVPENEFCSFEYQIEWKAEDDEKHGTAYEPNFTIDDLNACEEYEISVTVVYFDSNIINNPVRNTSATTEAIDAVEYLDIKKITENELVISWSIPPRVEKCLKKYIFKMYLDDHDTPSITLDPRQNYLTINNPKSCVNTTFEVTALSEKYRSNEKSVSHFYKKPNDPPIYNEKKTEISDNFVITKWTFGKFICRPKKFYVLCNIENQKPQFAVEGEFNVQSNELSAKIDKVEPNTMYSCCGIIENSEGESKCSEPGRFFTKTKPPDAPQNLKITEFDEYLNIKWEPPNKWNGKENNYNVSIEFQELKYVLPEYCQNISFDPIEETLDASETEFNFSTIIPASRYKISVKAKSDGGWGQEIEQDFYLAESIPEEPVMTAELFNPTSLNLSWTTPCKMHGKLQKYHYVLSGIKEDCESDYKEGDIIRSEDDNDYYSKIFDNLKYDYNYTIQLHAENEKQIGATAETTVITPPGCPDAPENLNITEYDEYLNIKWEPPNEWNGKKESYYVLIVYQGLNYDLPEYCQTVSFDPFEKTLDTSERELNFSTIIPASRYKISVKAKSNGGWGKEIENTYNLTESIPEKPQVTYKLISSTDRNYNTSLNLTWSTPCKMHGKLYGFRIKILGTRDKFDSDDKGIENIPFRESQYYWEIYEDLKPDYKYTVEVQARNEHLGDKTELIFYSPAGSKYTKFQLSRKPLLWLIHNSNHISSFKAPTLKINKSSILFMYMFLGRPSMYFYNNGINYSY